MDSKEIRGLMEAYVEVYAPQEEIEEGLRSAVKRLFGGGKKETGAPKPESRGAELRRKYNVGPERSDTSAKRQILDRSRARAERDEKEFGGSKYSKTVAQKSKASHDRYLKAGYSKYGADDARGSGNKARKRAAALNREEFEFIVNALIEEGYDLSSYTWDEMYEICLDEAVKGADPEMRRAAAAERRSGDKPLPAKEGEKYADFKKAQVAYIKRKMKEELDIFDIVLEFLQSEGYAETLEEAEWLMANVIDEEAIEIILGEEQLDEISQKTATKAYAISSTGEFEGADSPRDIKRTDRLKGHIERKFGKKAGEHAERAAHSMTFGRKGAGGMPKVSEEYVDEAQAARENPEKYEREQAKKSAPVRGERTSMPPRGDKRREDFEKWYAANVR